MCRREESAAASRVQVGQLEGRLGHVSGSLATVEKDLATAKTCHAEAIQVRHLRVHTDSKVIGL